MNVWTNKSIELANQRNYLDLLFKIYPMSVNLKRELDNQDIEQITKSFNEKNSQKLLEVLLSQEIFPIKDSYVAYLKRDKSAIERNPNTVQRLTGMLYEMGLDEIFNKTTLPKETNRQIGPLFKKWIDSGSLGCKVTIDPFEFLNFNGNIIFNGTDTTMKYFANKHLGYDRNKGLDFIAKFNNKFILAETKFLTDFGGHQNAQYEDAILTMRSKLRETTYNVKIISILDGVLFIKGKNKMYTSLCNDFTNNDVIISAVLLRDYLYSL